VICEIDNPTPIGFINVFESGDVWKKIRGCESCPDERRRKCCGRCALRIGADCRFNIEEIGHSKKPFYCVWWPPPNEIKTNCYLEFKCIAGSKIGKTLRVRDGIKE
jgi:hypothetical protein